MSASLFRKQATAAFLNDETRGTIVQVTPPAMTVAFVTVTALVVGALALGLFVRVEIPLEGRGRLRSSERGAGPLGPASFAPEAGGGAPDARSRLVGTLELAVERHADVNVGARVRLAFDACPPDGCGFGAARVVRVGRAGVRTPGETPRRGGWIEAEISVDELPRGDFRADEGMTFTGRVATGETRLASFLLPGIGK